MIRELSGDEVVRLHGELEEIHRGSGDPIFPPGIKNRGLLVQTVKISSVFLNLLLECARTGPKGHTT